MGARCASGISGTTYSWPGGHSRAGDSVRNQTGGRVFLFLHTDDFWRDYKEMTARESEVHSPAEPRNLMARLRSSKIYMATCGTFCSRKIASQVNDVSA